MYIYVEIRSWQFYTYDLVHLIYKTYDQMCKEQGDIWLFLILDHGNWTLRCGKIRSYTDKY